MYRLLIIDDAGTGRELLRSVDWAAAGFDTVELADTFSKAARKAMELRPHTIVIAARLDGDCGIGLMEYLQMSGLKAVFAVVVDGKDLSAIRKAVRAGARDVLPRPVSGGDLLEFARWSVARDVQEPSAAPREDGAGIDPVLGVDCTAFSKVTCMILRVVRSDYRSSLSLTAIAQRLNMSSKYIGRVFLKDTGMRFTEYLMRYRMCKARDLIQGTEEKISAIAGMVGYAQLNNFYTHFRNYFGVSPTALRKGGRAKGDMTCEKYT